MRMDVRLYRAAEAGPARRAVATVTLTDRRDDASFAPPELNASAKFFLQSVHSEDRGLTDSIASVLRRDSMPVSRSTSSHNPHVRTRGDMSAREPYGTTAYWLAAVGRLETELPVELDPADWKRMVDTMEEVDVVKGAVAEAVADLAVVEGVGGEFGFTHEAVAEDLAADSVSGTGVAGDDAPLPPAEWLATLDPDPVRAERCYQSLKRDLTRFLEWQHDDPEAAAQEALVRGLARMANGADTSKAGPRGFLFGFAKKLVQEGWRIRERERPLDPVMAERRPSAERDHARVDARLMLEKVLGELSPRDRRIIVRYCTEKDHTRQCEELGVNSNYLRQIVYRIREGIRERMGVDLERVVTHK